MSGDYPIRKYLITIVTTVYNRRDLTLQALEAIYGQVFDEAKFVVNVVLVDDGSSDGTKVAVQRAFPDVKVLHGTGSLFWSGGMALGQRYAQLRDPDAIIWLNDDVRLYPDAFAELFAAYESSQGSTILVGATEGSDGRVTYCGARLRSRRPGSLVPVEPSDRLTPIDTFNGNFVLIPREAYRRLGTVDGHFVHAYGDIDYGLRARKMGIPAALLPRPVGLCEPNASNMAWRDSSLRRSERIRMLIGRRGYPPAAHWRYNVRHGGPMRGPLYFAASYVRAAGGIIFRGSS